MRGSEPFMQGMQNDRKHATHMQILVPSSSFLFFLLFAWDKCAHSILKDLSSRIFLSIRVYVTMDSHSIEDNTNNFVAKITGSVPSWRQDCALNWFLYPMERRPDLREWRKSSTCTCTLLREANLVCNIETGRCSNDVRTLLKMGKYRTIKIQTRDVATFFFV